MTVVEADAKWPIFLAHRFNHDEIYARGGPTARAVRVARAAASPEVFDHWLLGQPRADFFNESVWKLTHPTPYLGMFGLKATRTTSLLSMHFDAWLLQKAQGWMRGEGAAYVAAIGSAAQCSWTIPADAPGLVMAQWD
eukprot:CAMPEP_0119107142 /NCGR_PEP_ID=MMETSP1180-20130426/8431_1 /TAXON_ID=3052 ORGANISM="Chlamydomonas cf sp, Strain CCMP681" /NCGR_SAMPLE_ID=MMETSP1180 /ASSEMBLY_ACC=CAM_ASM_000741 /LENGTH=137 /DNA_ID=CAMNT_0007092585 /DNA_START=27 /DNA_END=440 /DNA_ORIENTATION=+